MILYLQVQCKPVSVMFCNRAKRRSEVNGSKTLSCNRRGNPHSLRPNLTPSSTFTEYSNAIVR